MLLLQSLHWQLPLKRAFVPCRPFLLWHDHIRFLFHPLTVFCQLRFVGLGEDPGVLAVRAPELFGVRPMFRFALP